ncbi:hypothetical protein [Breznakibacter xylanolyticus]|uniref:hypothetical protein n=1 Tax=Breznakibacter xylanolyticus TaxID=990 RepID=UPI0014732341|nr:hypothetical protein [Breznakibacter xylanolyticus]MBN2744317.1 hypothetical protein [Marinilabiliaceae bacterium]
MNICPFKRSHLIKTIIFTMLVIATTACASSRTHRSKSRFRGAIPCPCENQH